jgi:hypothetical protein
MSEAQKVERFRPPLPPFAPALSRKTAELDQARFIRMQSETELGEPFPKTLQERLHKYLYADADPVDGMDPSGYENIEGPAITSQNVTRQSIFTRLGASMRGVTLGQVQRGAKLAYDTICCLDKAWSVLDLALQVTGTPGSSVLSLIDMACKLDCSSSKDGGKTFIVYSKSGPNGTYIGRASGFGTPDSILSRRNGNHRIPGRGTIEFTTGSYAVARGLEQLLIDGVLGEGGSLLNKIGGIGKRNPNAGTYLKCALDFLNKGGLLH